MNETVSIILEIDNKFITNYCQTLPVYTTKEYNYEICFSIYMGVYLEILYFIHHLVKAEY